jgi:hypothetical protein
VAAAVAEDRGPVGRGRGSGPGPAGRGRKAEGLASGGLRQPPADVLAAGLLRPPQPSTPPTCREVEGLRETGKNTNNKNVVQNRERENGRDFDAGKQC